MSKNTASIEQSITDGLDAVETMMRQELQFGSAVLEKITSHLAKAGGKRMRPLLTLSASQLGLDGKPLPPQVVRAAVVVELTHLATLYHDDVMDDAPRRRNVSTAQVQWGNSMAILAGDIIFAACSRLLADLGPEAVRAHARTFERLCIGQMNETLGVEVYPQVDPIRFYLQVLADKTGSLVNCAARYGAFFGGCPDATVSAVGLFGEYVGVAFQLVDDVIDLQSVGGVSGKTPGTDLREGVKTMPVLLLEALVEGGRSVPGSPTCTTPDLTEPDSNVRHVDSGKLADPMSGLAGVPGLETFLGQLIRQAEPASAQDAELLSALRADLSDDAVLAQVADRLAAHRVTTLTKQLAEYWVDLAVKELQDVASGVVRDGLVEFARAQINRMA